MAKLKKFIKVSYESPEQAKAALQLAESTFYRSVLAHSHNLNRVEGNSAYFVRSMKSAHDKKIEEFLLAQAGALPAGCHVGT